MNIYYDPEKFGLRIAGEMELTEPSYSFDTVVVFTDGVKWLVAHDSGCSCPSPFEDVGITDCSWFDSPQDALNHVQAKYLDVRVREREGWYDEANDFAKSQFAEMAEKVTAGVA